MISHSYSLIFLYDVVCICVFEASCHQELDDAEILQSVIGSIGDVDSPMSVDQKVSFPSLTGRIPDGGSCVESRIS